MKTLKALKAIACYIAGKITNNFCRFGGTHNGEFGTKQVLRFGYIACTEKGIEVGGIYF